MLERIPELLKSYRTTVQSAKAERDKAIKEYNENYIGKMNTEKVNAANDAFNNIWLECRENTINSCIQILDDVKAKAEKFAAQPVDSNFPAVIAAVKAIKNPTPEELNIIVKSTKSNYLTYRAICDAVGGAVKGFSPILIDDVIEVLESLKDDIQRVLSGYAGNFNSYTFQLVEQGDYIKKYDEFITTFLSGRFDEAGEMVKSDNENEDDPGAAE